MALDLGGGMGGMGGGTMRMGHTKESKIYSMHANILMHACMLTYTHSYLKNLTCLPVHVQNMQLLLICKHFYVPACHVQACFHV